MSRPNRVARTALIAVLVVVAIGLVYVLGTVLTPSSYENARQEVASTAAVAPGSEGVLGTSGTATTDELKAQDASAGDAAATPSEPMVITTGSMDIQVDDIDDAVTSVREIVKQQDAQISDLTIQRGSTDVVPLAGAESDVRYSGPATAYLTLRVAAEKLDALQSQLAALGDVTAQSVSANDVTEQYVDLTARMKNLKAEEARLRSFLGQTNRVSDLLEVERELSRVRGEIEAMQAQIDYLERQSARATLTVMMTEPASVVRPSDTNWGFGDAITRGIQGAAAVLTTMITGIIALAPVALLALAIWLVARAVRRRRHTGAGTDGEDVEPAPEASASGEDE